MAPKKGTKQINVIKCNKYIKLKECIKFNAERENKISYLKEFKSLIVAGNYHLIVHYYNIREKSLFKFTTKIKFMEKMAGKYSALQY